MVEPEMKKKATQFFWFLIVLYIIYGIESIASTVQKRFKPPIFLSRDADDTSFAAPYFTFCNYDAGYPEVQCAYDRPQETTTLFCDMNDNSTFEYFDETDEDMTNPRFCTSVNIIEDITSTPPSIMLYIVGAVDEKITYYVSANKLDAIAFQEASPGSYDVGLFLSSGRYSMEITKQTYSHLMTFAGGLRVFTQETETFNANTLFTTDTFDVDYFEEDPSDYSPTSSPTISPISDSSAGSSSVTASNSTSDIQEIFLIVFSNPLGIDELEEIDPVDMLSLISSIAGVLPYTLLVFSIVFAKSIYRNKMRMEYQNHIRMMGMSTPTSALI